MGTRDPRIDAYIANSADFARPILEHLRAVVHAACPDVEETMKWGFPHFVHHGLLCNMASFKAHCVFGFWKASLILDDDGRGGEAMGQFGRITSMADLPPKQVLAAYVKKAAALNERGVKKPARSPRSATELLVPDDLMAALRGNRKALATFEGFSPSNRREYVEWIVDAKTESTRQRRLATALEWMAEGKPRNWKYM
ncbi:MAG TPA: YdeI/OmpD-associated family protein [Gemmatimonadaceae bacterium]|nr:YdeI/OmpD-associated family protein [Gemmatimonadaceae bacterium]